MDTCRVTWWCDTHTPFHSPTHHPPPNTRSGTYFARCVVPRGSALPSRLGLPCGPPALLAVRQGALLGRAPLSALGGGGGGDVWDEVVLSYLRRLRVLASKPGGGSCSSASDDEGGDDEGDGNRGGNNKARRLGQCTAL